MSSPDCPSGCGRLLATLLLHVTCSFLFFHTVTCQYIEIQTELGRVRGVRIQSQMNNAAIAFLGIPYALPPTGERRFKVPLFILSQCLFVVVFHCFFSPRLQRPVSYPKWSPKTLVATNYKSCCPQLDMNGVPHGAEDCLYLNVFLPLHNIDHQVQFAVATMRKCFNFYEGPQRGCNFNVPNRALTYFFGWCQGI